MTHDTNPAPDTTYICTYLGNRFYPLEGLIDAIHLEDIAHGLAYQCRFNGQTSEFYSIAQHSLMVADIVPPELRFAALLHDASEAYLGDVVKPLKALLPNYKDIELRVEKMIAAHFGIADMFDPRIKQADMIALATEKRDLMPHSAEDWSYLRGFEPLPEAIDPMSPQQAKRAFLIEVNKARATPGGRRG
jgi:5'-deoxynucleotidase YfbR-like HD superfamily hydrolase